VSKTVIEGSNPSAPAIQKPSADQRDFVGGWFLFCPKAPYLRRFRALCFLHRIARSCGFAMGKCNKT
ncbi:MAG TPA: hypothetical protein PKI76_08065, partial [Oscillospiraceae bacterium]|nr:hypothetical protein [Oscillospiraceae bacterium]